jgi:hypothetical protein
VNSIHIRRQVMLHSNIPKMRVPWQ